MDEYSISRGIKDKVSPFVYNPIINHFAKRECMKDGYTYIKIANNDAKEGSVKLTQTEPNTGKEFIITTSQWPDHTEMVVVLCDIDDCIVLVTEEEMNTIMNDKS